MTLQQDIKIVVNNKEQEQLPPLLRVFSDVYNGMNDEFNNLRQDLLQRQEKFRTINKDLLKRLKPQK